MTIRLALMIAALAFGAMAQPVQPKADPAAAAVPPQDASEATQSETAPVPAVLVKNRRPFESLTFTTDEFNEIRGRIGTGGTAEANNNGRQAIEDATLYLSTIVYYGPKDWTIWVNGVPISPDQEFKSFQVTEIDADHVDLLVPLSAQGMRPVRLAPNQTFVTKTGAVVEGQVEK